MNIRDGFVGSVGNTPLIKLRRASKETGCTILGKAEFLNPGGSVKDRAALYIIKDAEERGQLRPGGVIVEGTAGSGDLFGKPTGIARKVHRIGVRHRRHQPQIGAAKAQHVLLFLALRLRHDDDGAVAPSVRCRISGG